MGEILGAEGNHNLFEEQDALIKMATKLGIDDITKFAVSLGIPYHDINKRTEGEVKSMVAAEIVRRKTPAEIEEARRKINNLDEADIHKFKLEQDLR